MAEPAETPQGLHAQVTRLPYSPGSSAAYPERLPSLSLARFPDVNFPLTSPINLLSRPPFSGPAQPTMFKAGTPSAHLFITSEAKYVCTLQQQQCCMCLFPLMPLSKVSTLCKGLSGQLARTKFPDWLGFGLFQIFASVCHINTLCCSDMMTYFRLRKQGSLELILLGTLWWPIIPAT